MINVLCKTIDSLERQSVRLLLACLFINDADIYPQMAAKPVAFCGTPFESHRHGLWFLLKLINTRMQNHYATETISQPRRYQQRTPHHAIDQRLLEALKALGLVRYGTDFSYQCGKNPGNFRSMKRLPNGLHIGTLMLLAARYVKILKDSSDAGERARYRAGLAAIKQAIDDKCSLRNAEIDARRAQAAHHAAREMAR